MEKTDQKYQTYVEILKEELVPAMGCTEPIAIAYAAARAREVLGALPDRAEIGVRGNNHQEREERGGAQYGRPARHRSGGCGRNRWR